MFPLRYLQSGHVLITPEDDCDEVVDALLETDYNEEFCIAMEFDTDFISRLMEAGFLVMSTEIKDDAPDDVSDGVQADEETVLPPFFVLLPKLHLVRSALFFPELQIKKSIRKFLSCYELRFNEDFNFILGKCVEIHGAAWLTPPLVGILKEMHQNAASIKAMPVSFGLYREGKLVAGEIGVVAGKVYTSYSGYREEDNAGTVQMILMTQWLEKNGFAFLDFGMPLPYKTDLGAQDITPEHFVELFRSAKD